MKKQLLTYILLIIFSTRPFAQTEPAATPQWRPVYHFTPEKNWTNDPNGLIYLNGVYHLYNQQNPFENKWGHMSWGHATSTDLVTWKHLPVAIPEKIDKDTTWIFSGSAVLDKDNTSGFCKNDSCLVAIYTAHQPNLHKESQYIAYSNDGGATYTNYNKNPVIDLNKKDFRDPNVFWYAPTKQWIMVTVLPTEHKAMFYGSVNLRDWNLLSAFGPAGFTTANWECPFLIQLPVEGNPALKKWMLAISAGGRERGPFIQYFTGDFNGKEFKNDNPADTTLAVDYGDCFYAAIPWNNLPDNKKIFIGWMVPQGQDTYPWKGQMSIPRDLSLRQTSTGLRMVQQPAAIVKNELNKLSGNHVITLNNLKIDNTEIPVSKDNPFTGNSYWLQAELLTGAGTTAGFKIAQQKNKDNHSKNEIEIGYDERKHELYVDRSKAGIEKIRKDKLRQTFPLQNSTGIITLEILVDRSSLEVFINNGEKALTTYIFPEEHATGIAAFATGGSATIKSLKIWDLSKMTAQ